MGWYSVTWLQMVSLSRLIHMRNWYVFFWNWLSQDWSTGITSVLDGMNFNNAPSVFLSHVTQDLALDKSFRRWSLFRRCLFVDLPQLHWTGVFTPEIYPAPSLDIGKSQNSPLGVQKKITSPLQHIFAPYFLFGIPPKKPIPMPFGSTPTPSVRCWCFCQGVWCVSVLQLLVPKLEIGRGPPEIFGRKVTGCLLNQLLSGNLT